MLGAIGWRKIFDDTCKLSRFDTIPDGDGQGRREGQGDMPPPKFPVPKNCLALGKIVLTLRHCVSSFSTFVRSIKFSAYFFRVTGASLQNLHRICPCMDPDGGGTHTFVLSETNSWLRP